MDSKTIQLMTMLFTGGMFLVAVLALVIDLIKL